MNKLKADILKTKGEQPIDNKAQPRRKTKFVDADMEYDVNVNLGGGQFEEDSEDDEGEGKTIMYIKGEPIWQYFF